ncbi:APC family permease [Nostoc sp. 'Lobaria pulmonaria (5183) cyanobiont']|uniref:APC family permease n=1 Tax=Nostoc sp. 'Lobaria pulmonaria (5183) cyanobiont' TaxID=1618022 RepID=UPI000CF31674|nr:amino acid permease [Nostoc sp. 'Lobaria pulmonaria (5183) cyanobiont']AVH73717.1 amino acid/polyamine transporter [Nostoc sp. 'Lobaria pulmonaria (5183) cyanobiont']
MSRRKNYNLLAQTISTEVTTPKPSLTLPDAVALIVGVVIGAGIFETPALVASQAGSNIAVLLFWLMGGVVSLVGALCYAELATVYPDVGGVYYYLKRAFGRGVAFLFAWARMTVIQTGSIALLAFVFGDYVSQIWRLGTFSSSIYAAIAIALLTVLNIIGLQQGKWTQNLLSAAKVLGLLLVVIIGLTAIPNSATPVESTSSGTWGLAMVFVFLSYGGWNEAAYIAAEIQDGRRNIVRSLMWSIGIITAIYLLINLAYLRGLGLANMAQSEAVAADLMRSLWGESGALFISVLIAIATLGATNATIFTGARTNYALGQDFSLFGFMGRWQQRPSSPTYALFLQAAIALVLVFLGTLTRKGFETMVDYTAPIFWFFFLLSGISLLVLRIREPHIVRPFRVPFYPFTPLLFCAVCAYLLYSSLVYTGVGAIAGILVVAAGIPLLFWNNYRQRRT